jgi:hypothetical protein
MKPSDKFLIDLLVHYVIMSLPRGSPYLIRKKGNFFSLKYELTEDLEALFCDQLFHIIKNPRSTFES